MTLKMNFLCTVFGLHCKVWVVEGLQCDFCEVDQDKPITG